MKGLFSFFCVVVLSSHAVNVGAAPQDPPPGSVMTPPARPRAIAKTPALRRKQLLQGLKSKSRYDRTVAANALIKMGKNASFAMKAAVPLLYEKYAISNKLGVKLLTQIGFQSFPILQEVLRKGKPIQQGHAAHGIATFRARAAAAIPDLLRIARHKEPFTREAALQALLKMGKKAHHLLPLFVEHLEDPYWWVRITVLKGLADFGSAAEPALPYFAQMLVDPDPRTRRVLADILVRFGSAAIPHLLRIFDTPPLARACRDTATFTPEEKRAIAVLARMKGLVLPALRTRLAPTQPRVQRAAIAILQQMDASAAIKAMPSLLHALSKTHSTNKEAFAALLCSFGEKAVTPLFDAIQVDTEGRDLAITSLACVGQKTLPTVKTWLTKGKVLQQRMALQILQQSKAELQSILPTLLRLASGPDATMRQLSHGVLLQYNTHANSKKARQALIQWAKQQTKTKANADQTHTALTLLIAQNTKIARPQLQTWYRPKKPDSQAREEHRRLLLTLMSTPSNQHPTRLQFLKKTLSSTSPTLLKAAIQGIGRYKNKARSLAPALFPFLRYKDRSVRLATIHALHSIAAGDQATTAAMLHRACASKGPKDQALQQALVALAKQDLNPFVLSMHDARISVRICFLQAIGALPSQGRLLASTIASMLADKDKNVRFFALATLHRLYLTAQSTIKTSSNTKPSIQPKPSQRLRQKVAKALIAHYPKDGAWVKQPDALEHHIQSGSLFLLRRWQIDTPQTRAFVQKALKGQSDQARYAALETAYAFKINPKATRKALFAQLQHYSVNSIPLLQLLTNDQLHNAAEHKALVVQMKNPNTRMGLFYHGAMLLYRSSKYRKTLEPLLLDALRQSRSRQKQAIRVLRTLPLRSPALSLHLANAIMAQRKALGVHCEAYRLWQRWSPLTEKTRASLLRQTASKNKVERQGSLRAVIMLGPKATPQLLSVFPKAPLATKQSMLRGIRAMAWKSAALLPMLHRQHKKAKAPLKASLAQTLKSFGPLHRFPAP